jgi:anti-sigma B factor antagonist
VSVDGPVGFRVALLRPAADLALVEAVGELDIHTSVSFKQMIVDVIEGGVPRVAVDLTGVTFIDSSALGALVGGARRCAERGCEFMIVCPAGSVARVIQVTGLNRAFAIYATRREALGGLGESPAQ